MSLKEVSPHLVVKEDIDKLFAETTRECEQYVKDIAKDKRMTAKGLQGHLDEGPAIILKLDDVVVAGYSCCCQGYLMLVDEKTSKKTIILTPGVTDILPIKLKDDERTKYLATGTGCLLSGAAIYGLSPEERIRIEHGPFTQYHHPGVGQEKFVTTSDERVKLFIVDEDESKPEMFKEVTEILSYMSDRIDAKATGKLISKTKFFSAGYSQEKGSAIYTRDPGSRILI